jgi:hypothetical protein
MELLLVPAGLLPPEAGVQNPGVGLAGPRPGLLGPRGPERCRDWRALQSCVLSEKHSNKGVWCYMVGSLWESVSHCEGRLNVPP